VSRLNFPTIIALLVVITGMIFMFAALLNILPFNPYFFIGIVSFFISGLVWAFVKPKS